MQNRKEPDYTELHQLLRDTLAGSMSKQWMAENGMSLRANSFHSDNAVDESLFQHTSSYDVFFDPETAEKYNNDFNYYVFAPDSKRARKECIVMLHGLNERNWDKYLPWAYTLAKQTGKSVILFPIAYHMDRSPDHWKDPRKMMPYVRRRKSRKPGINMSTVVNVALSERLTTQPERFFFSGYQAAGDVLKLMDQITSGDHQLFDKDTKIDFFSYSIGTFLTQTLMLANPENRLDNSKFFFFCSGSAFHDMHGESKYILDSVAYKTLRSYYPETFENDLKMNNSWRTLFDSSPIGESFRAMLSLSSLKKYSTNLFSKFQDRLMTVVLKQDKVIVPEMAKKVLRGTRFEEIDFNYRYVHENPFPVTPNPGLRDHVNSAFDRFMGMAIPFFT